MNLAQSDLTKINIFDAAKAADPEQTVTILLDAGIIEPKSWWSSIGINGSIVTLVPAVVALVSSLARSYGWDINVGAVTEGVMGLFGLAAAAMTWWGRVYASQPISRVKVLPGVTRAA